MDWIQLKESPYMLTRAQKKKMPCFSVYFSVYCEPDLSKVLSHLDAPKWTTIINWKTLIVMNRRAP